MYNTRTMRLSLRAIYLLACCILFCTASLAQPDTLCYDCAGIGTECGIPPISTNAELTTPCPELDILFILDESGSMGVAVEEIEVAGKEFDMLVMEAVEMVEGENGKVVEVILKGYKLKNKVIRPVKVKVGLGKKEK